MIKTYLQGTDGDSELFGSIGAWLVDKDIHARLGIAPTAARGDIWWIDYDDDGQVIGFANARRFKLPKLHIRLLIAVDDDAERPVRLVQAIEEYARATPLKQIYTNDRATSDFWPTLGYRMAPPNKRRGVFRRFEKDLL
ncbi:hypothetical protein [Niveispirillum fermenti]|uniref:hypothetical protein n=1 Tax=Niveispirillum fermenti TaxID=1233113 RepID=UPI003A8ABFDE